MTTIDTTQTDDRALEMRRAGKRFKTIATALGLQRPSEANAAFNRALRRLPVEEQTILRAEEHVRLDQLAEAVRQNSTLSKEKVDSRLRSLDRLRAGLLSD